MQDIDDVLSLIPAAPGRGLVMPIGGAEDTNGNSDVLREFARLAGGDRAHIVVIPTASETPDESGRGYANLFRQLGVPTVEALRPETPLAAERVF